MSDSDFTELIRSLGQDYFHRGPHFIKLYTEADLQEPVELSLFEDQTSGRGLTSLTERLWEAIKCGSMTQEVRFVFTGNMNDISAVEQQKWFLQFLSLPESKITKYFCNKKLKILIQLTDLFLSVYCTEGPNVTKCNLEHQLILHPACSEANIESRLVWYNHSYSSRGEGNCSAYKIFYAVAAGTGSAVMNSNTTQMVEKRFLSEDRIKEAKLNFNALLRLLRDINFSENEINKIVETLVALVELSQYRAEGDGKKLEFNGLNHFKKVAENLLVKESQLRAFIINEYLWQDNKRKLKTPDIINSEIDAFIAAIYDVLVQSVWAKYNRFVEKETKSKEFFTLRFINSPSLPLFSKEKIYMFGDYLQYYFSINFESLSSNHIQRKMKSFLNSASPTDVREKEPELKLSRGASMATYESICGKLNDYKNSKNRAECWNKLEKSNLKDIQFLKINQQTFVDIYIPEMVSFVRFGWQSFVEGSERFCSKQMKAFLKLSGNPVLNNFHFRETPAKLWTADDFSAVWSSEDLFEKNILFIHSVMEQSREADVTYSLKCQIRDGYLHYLQADQLLFEVVPLDEFVRKYGVAFLNWNDASRAPLEAVRHAIHRFRFEKAWCCSKYVHLSSDHISSVAATVGAYNDNVLKIQGYARVILAKIKLKKLKLSSDLYKKEYLDALLASRHFFQQFNEELSPICNIDVDCKDLKILSESLPDQKSIESLKSIEKDNTEWLNVTIFSGVSLIHRELFSSSQVCLFYSQEDKEPPQNCLDIGKYLSPDLRSQIHNVVILKVQVNEAGDVFVDVKARTPPYVWNVTTEENKSKRKHFPLSQGSLLSMSRYRIFSNDYFINKLAYNTLNKIAYASFNELVQECTTAIILQKNDENENCLARSLLWISITNCLPLVNLESTSTFNLVERRRRIIDKMECSKYVDYLHVRPRNDWVFENVATELLFLSSKDDSEFDTSDDVGPGHSESVRNSVARFEHSNYKIRKFIQS